ncbi:copia protein [Tanacetum coccineum]
MNSIEQCIIERASHEQELKMTLKKLSERQLQIQQCKVQEVQSSVTSSGDETSSGIEVSPDESSSTSQPLEQVKNHDENDVFANVRRHSEQPESINDTYVLEKDDSNVIPDSSNICTNDNQVDQNAAECVDERAALANLIANLTLDTEENKTVLKQLKKANASLTQELKECKTNLDESSRALGEATSSRDSSLIALQTKQTELEKYTALNDKKFCPNGEETVTLEKESRSKLDKDTVNPRASAQNKDAKSHKTTKRYMPVEKSSASKKPERQISTGHRFSNKKTITVPEKTMNPRSSLRWKPTGRILKTVCLRWVPTGKLLNSCTGKVESEPTHGSKVDIHHIHACKQTLDLSAGTSFNGQKQQRIDITADALYNEKQENLRVCSSSLGRRCQMVSAENNTSGPNSEFKTTTMNRQVPSWSKKLSSSSQDSYITTRVGITIPPSYSNAEDNRNMNPVATQQIAHDNALVTPDKRLKIESCNARTEFSKPLKEETYQITLDALKLSLCYIAFQITAEVPEIYMHQFWNSIKKIGKTDAYDFKLDKKKCRVDTEVFHKILQICPLLPNQDFVELPSENDLLSFIKVLGYSGNCEMLSTIRTDQMHQPWRKFAAVVNMCISGKSTGLDRLRESRAQKYGALIPDGMINDDIKLSTTYKTYLEYATGKVSPKKARKFKKPASPKLKIVPASPKEPTQKGKRVKRPAKRATTIPSTGVVIRDTLAKSASGSSEGADFESKVPDEQTGKTKDTSEGTGVIPGVPDVSKKDSSNSDDDSWGNSEDENDDFNDEDDDGGNDDDIGSNDDGDNDAQDNEQTDSNDDENPSFTLKDFEEEEQDEEYVFSLKKDKSDDEEKMYEEEDDDVAKELYGDLNITQGLRDTDMTNVEQGREDLQNASHESGFVLEEDDGHVTLMTVHDKTEGTMQSSSIPSDFTSKLLNLDNTGPDVNDIASLMSTAIVPPSPPPVNPFSHLTTTPQKQTPDSTTTTTNPTITLPEILNFTSLFRFEQRLKEEAKAENQEFLNQVDSTIKAIIKEQVNAQVSMIMPLIEKYVTESLGAKVLVRSTNQPQSSYAVAASLS